MRRLVLGVGVTAVFLGALSCHPAGHGTRASIAPDSLRGIVSITGTGFDQQIALRSDNHVSPLAPSTADSSALSRLGGVEVLVIGTRTGDRFHVDRFTAVSVAGSPVVDGILRDDGGRLSLETAQGRMTLGNPPTALRNLIAARVWIGGPLDSGPNTFGVIVPPKK